MNLQENDPSQNMSARDSVSLPGDGSQQVLKENLEDYARKVSHSLAREISETRSFAVEELKSLSVKLDEMAGVLNEMAVKLREKQMNSLADLVETSSESMKRLSSDFREKYVERMAEQVENFARTRPMIFWGAALTAGILIWQLSSPPQRMQSGVDMSSAEPTPGEEERHEWH